MIWNTALTQLRDVLADLYSIEADLRRVAAEAGLTPQHIAFSSKAINNWQTILEEAHKQDKVEALASVALKEYQKNTSLQVAVDAYREWVAQNKEVDTVEARVEQTDVSSHYPPLQRPPHAEHFTDRERELARLLQDLQPGQVVTLWGPGGIGKSALAAEAVRKIEPERFPDGIIFYTFYGQPNVDLALEHIVTSFGSEPKPIPKMAALRVLARKRALLILDGAEEADKLQKVLEVRGECGVLVTSRKKRDAIAVRQDVAPLPTAKAVDLLRAWGGDRAADEPAAKRICELVGGLPLAVRLVGRYLDETGETAAEYLEWLEAQPLDALHHGKHRKESVDVLLQRSLEHVSESARMILAVSGRLAFAPFTKEVLAAALALPDVQLHRPFSELVDYGILLRSDDCYEVSHALIHTYTRQRIKVNTEILGRLAMYYVNFAKNQREQGGEGRARLDAERTHLIKVIENCQEQEEWQAVSHLVRAVDDYLDIQGYWTERQAALEAGVRAVRNMNKQGDEGNFLRRLGNTYHVLGQVGKAIECYEQALTIDRKIVYQRGEGADLDNLGNAYQDLGQVEKAIECYEQAMTILRESSDRCDEGRVLGHLGSTYQDLGQVEKAIEYYEQALVIARESLDKRGEGTVLGNLGRTYQDLGQVEKAIEYYEQALAIDREIGDRRGEGADLCNLGRAYQALGQIEKAIEYCEQALAIDREIGDRQGEGVDLNSLGSAYRNLKQVEKTIEYCRQALTIHQDVGYRQGEGDALGELGNAYRDLGQIKKSIKYFEQALSIHRDIGYLQGEAEWLNSLGTTFRDLGQAEQATEYYQQALKILEEIRSPDADLVRKWLDELETTLEG